MRIGVNPQKSKELQLDQYTHQVVIPVYIPNSEDNYFKDGLKILKICLESLIKTSHKNTFVTIVNNGSSLEVKEYLSNLFNENKIQEIVHTSNIGKINSVIKGVKGHYFKLITIADADTFFLPNWQKEVVSIFNSFPKAGVVGVVPQFRMYSYMCYNILFECFFSKKLKFTKVPNPEAMKHFYKSIGWDDNYNKDFLKLQLTIKSKNNLKAVVGAGHFVATYRSETFLYQPNYEVKELIGTKSDRDFLDTPIVKKGGWRLTTENNYAYHMGNIYEDWMSKELSNLNSLDAIKEYDFDLSNNLKSNTFNSFIKNDLFRKLLSYKPFFNWFTRYKGLPKNIAKTPWHE